MENLYASHTSDIKSEYVTEKPIRLIVSDNIIGIGSWDAAKQNLARLKAKVLTQDQSLTRSKATLNTKSENGPLKNGTRADHETFTVCSATHVEELQSIADNSKVSNKCHLVGLTSISGVDDGIKKHSNPVPDIQRKTKKPSTLDVFASKRRKIDITPAMQLAAKKIALNDSSPLISLKRREHVGDQRGRSSKKDQTPQLNKQKAPTQIRNRHKWTSIFGDSSADGLDNAFTFNVRNNIPPIRRTMSAKAINNLVSVIKAVAEGSRQRPHVPLPMPSVSTNSIPRMTQISSRPGAGKVKEDPVAAENKRAASKKVQPSSPSLLPTENVEKILLPKDSSSSSIDDSNHQVVKTVRMNDQKMVQESRKVAKKSVTFSSTSLSVPEVCANFGLQDVHIDSKTIQRNDYKFYFSLVLPLLRKENPNVSMPTLVRLLAAKWRELSARDSVNEQIVDETENNGGNSLGSDSKDPAGEMGKSTVVANQEKAAVFQQLQIAHLNQEVADLRNIIESLVAKCDTRGSNMTSSSDTTGNPQAIPAPGNSSTSVGLPAESPNGSQASNTEAIKDHHMGIKLELDDDILFLCEVSNSE